MAEGRKCRAISSLDKAYTILAPILCPNSMNGLSKKGVNSGSISLIKVFILSIGDSAIRHSRPGNCKGYTPILLEKDFAQEL